MSLVYDVAILGCGEAGIFAAYELAKLRPDLKVLALDQGRDIYSRSCPIVAGKVKECIHCKVCDTMCGFGGAGAFSDGKFNFTTQFGGWLTDFVNMVNGADETVLAAITGAVEAIAVAGPALLSRGIAMKMGALMGPYGTAIFAAFIGITAAAKR